MLRSSAVASGLLFGLAVLTAAPRDARADDTPAVVAGFTVAAALGVGNIAFTAYSAGAINRNQEPNEKWMIAQTTVTGAETLAAGILGAYGAHDDKRGLAMTLLSVPITMWVGSLAGFSTWSLAAPGSDVPLQTRYLVSLLGATNLAFTSTAIGAATNERFSPYYLSIPEATLMAPASVLTAIKGGMDPDGRPGWIVLSVWSGVLSVHAIASIVGKATELDKPRPPPDTPSATPPTPAPDPSDPYYIDPAVPAPPRPIPAPPPAVVPAPIPGGASVAPGLSVVGAF